MAAATKNLVIEKGETFRYTFIVKDNDGNVRTDISSARMQIRRFISDVDTIVNLTVANGGITVTSASGRIDILITDTATSAIDHSSGVYDIEFILSNGDVKKWIKGSVTFYSEVTR